MFNNTKALVLREVRYKEADRILTLFTASDGKLTAKARGALRKSSRSAASTQQLTWSELTLFGNRGKWTVNEGTVLEPFAGLRADFEKLALGSYFAECLEAFSVEEQPDPALLQLGLNALYGLSSGKYEPLLVKAVFELRLMSLAGFQPGANACPVCGRAEPEAPYLQLEEGSVVCRACRKASFGGSAELCPDSLAALRYVIAAPAKQIFSFRLGGAALDRFSQAAERYLQAHAERRFPTLDYWKNVRKPIETIHTE